MTENISAFASAISRNHGIASDRERDQKRDAFIGAN